MKLQENRIPVETKKQIPNHKAEQWRPPTHWTQLMFIDTRLLWLNVIWFYSWIWLWVVFLCSPDLTWEPYLKTTEFSIGMFWLSTTIFVEKISSNGLVLTLGANSRILSFPPTLVSTLSNARCWLLRIFKNFFFLVHNFFTLHTSPQNCLSLCCIIWGLINSDPPWD